MNDCSLQLLLAQWVRHSQHQEVCGSLWSRLLLSLVLWPVAFPLVFQSSL